MRIIEPSAEIIHEPDPLKKIELCGRVCYKSEDKITTDSARGFVERIIQRGHTSVLEHARIQVPREWVDENITWGESVPYGFESRCKDNGAMVAMNARDFIFFGGTIDELAECHEADDYLTVRFICDRGVSHELVRSRVVSPSQESTRYCNYSSEMTFIKPCFDWAESIPVGIYDADDLQGAEDIFPAACDWLAQMDDSAIRYKRMTEVGCSPQEARSLLPNSLKTEIIMTATFSQWEDVLKLRLSKAAHPQMRQIMKMLVILPDFPSAIQYDAALLEE